MLAAEVVKFVFDVENPLIDIGWGELVHEINLK